jgi:hypothetical protein
LLAGVIERGEAAEDAWGDNPSPGSWQGILIHPYFKILKNRLYELYTQGLIIFLLFSDQT